MFCPNYIVKIELKKLFIFFLIFLEAFVALMKCFNSID